MIAYIELEKLAEVKVNFKDADFWVIRRGLAHELGRPISQFSLSHIGIRLNDFGLQLLNPGHLFDMLQQMHKKRFWELKTSNPVGAGSLRSSDLKKVSFPIEVPESFAKMASNNISKKLSNLQKYLKENKYDAHSDRLNQTEKSFIKKANIGSVFLEKYLGIYNKI